MHLEDKENTVLVPAGYIKMLLEAVMPRGHDLHFYTYDCSSTVIKNDIPY